VLDIAYCPIYLTQRLATERVQILVRLRSDRVFFGANPPRVPLMINEMRLHQLVSTILRHRSSRRSHASSSTRQDTRRINF
ncbi:hypothetical protein, partial [Nonomuraea guangzhouensis]